MNDFHVYCRFCILEALSREEFRQKNGRQKNGNRMYYGLRMNLLPFPIFLSAIFLSKFFVVLSRSGLLLRNRPPRYLGGYHSSARRDLQHPLDGQARSFNDVLRQLNSRRQSRHAITHFLQRIHFHEFALTTTA